MSEQTFVIVGANLTGGRAAEGMRKAGFEGRIVLIGEEPVRPYFRPPLSKDVLRSESEPDSVFVHPEQWYSEHDVELRLGMRATALDPSGSVTLSTGETIAFDRCLLATGGRPRTLDVPGADLEGIHYLRTLGEATILAEALQQKPRVAVVGAGFIGAEVAASAREVGCEVTVIEIFEVPLQRVLGEDLGRVYAQIHRDRGVDLRLGEVVERFEGADRVEAVVGSTGRSYPADLVVIGVGIVPNVELAMEAGIECDNGIGVDEHCRTSAPNVFAAGDVANWPDVYSGTRIRVEHFQNAQNQGAAAGRSMAGDETPFQDVPWFWSDQYEVNLQMLGHPSPDAERIIRGSLEARDFTAIHLSGGRIVAAVALNRGKDISAIRRMMERGISADPKQLADEDVSLKSLLAN
jgi:3-phenylpropionate/trans-cinnamate dioxygenase ferredoxin reductase subunit